MAALPPWRPIPWKTSDLTKWFRAAATRGCSFHKRPINTQEMILRYLHSLFISMSFLLFLFSALPAFPSFPSSLAVNPSSLSTLLLRLFSHRSHLFHLSSSLPRLPSIRFILTRRAFSSRAIFLAWTNSHRIDTERGEREFARIRRNGLILTRRRTHARLSEISPCRERRQHLPRI